MPASVGALVPRPRASSCLRAGRECGNRRRWSGVPVTEPLSACGTWPLPGGRRTCADSTRARPTTSLTAARQGWAVGHPVVALTPTSTRHGSQELGSTASSLSLPRSTLVGTSGRVVPRRRQPSHGVHWTTCSAQGPHDHQFPAPCSSSGASPFDKAPGAGLTVGLGCSTGHHAASGCGLTCAIVAQGADPRRPQNVEDQREQHPGGRDLGDVAPLRCPGRPRRSLMRVSDVDQRGSLVRCTAPPPPSAAAWSPAWRCDRGAPWCPTRGGAGSARPSRSACRRWKTARTSPISATNTAASTGPTPLTCWQRPVARMPCLRRGDPRVELADLGRPGFQISRTQRARPSDVAAGNRAARPAAMCSRRQQVRTPAAAAFLLGCMCLPQRQRDQLGPVPTSRAMPHGDGAMYASGTRPIRSRSARSAASARVLHPPVRPVPSACAVHLAPAAQRSTAQTNRSVSGPSSGRPTTDTA